MQKLALMVYTLRKRTDSVGWIKERSATLIRVWANHTKHQDETARRLAVDTW